MGDGCTDGWIDRRMGWGWLDGWVGGCGWLDEWLDWLLDGWLDVGG